MLIPHTRMALSPTWLVFIYLFNYFTLIPHTRTVYRLYGWFLFIYLFYVDTPYKDGCTAYMVGFILIIDGYNLNYEYVICIVIRFSIITSN